MRTDSAKHNNIKAFVRICPNVNTCWEYVKVLNDRKTVYVRRLQDLSVGYEYRSPLYWKFNTDGLFYNNTQEEIYASVVTPEILQQVFSGLNAIILSFGPTGTGKSLTAHGIHNLYEDRGIGPRILSSVFNYKKDVQGKYKVRVALSYVETKGSHFIDIFGKSKKIQEMLEMKNVRQIMIKNEKQGLGVLFKAEARREFVRDHTHYSHAANGVLTIYLTIKSSLSDSPPVCSKIHIVDLAGVDTIGNLSCLYKTIGQIGMANMAKTQLEQIILLMSEINPEQLLAKNRMNSLLYWLRDSLKPYYILRFIGHAGIKREELKLTLSIFRLAQILRQVREQRMRPESLISDDENIGKLKAKLAQAEKEKYLQMVFNDNRLLSNTPERIDHMRAVINDFAHNKIDDVALIYITDVTIALKLFKEMFNTLEAEKDTIEKALQEKMEQEMGRLPIDMHIKSQQSNQRLSVTSASRAKPANEKKIIESVPAQKKSLVGFRRSQTSRTSKDNRSSVSDFNFDDFENLTKLPPREVVYKMFMEDPTSGYKQLNDNVTEYANKFKDNYVEYDGELKLLDKKMKKYDECRQQFLNILIQKEAPTSAEERDVEGLQQIENDCKAALQTLEKAYVEQQEKVLTSYGGLKLNLGYFHEAKRELEEEYNNFCKAKFKIAMPKIEVEKEEFLEEVIQNVQRYSSTPEALAPDLRKEYYETLRHSLLIKIGGKTR